MQGVLAWLTYGWADYRKSAAFPQIERQSRKDDLLIFEEFPEARGPSVGM